MEEKQRIFSPLLYGRWFFYVYKPAAFHCRTLKTGVLKGLFQRHKVSLCRWFCAVEKSSDGRGNASAFSSNRKSHISKRKAFRNKAAIMFLWKGSLPFGLRYLFWASEGRKGEGTNEKRCIDGLFLSHVFSPSPFPPHAQPLSVCALPLEAVSVLSEDPSIMHPAAHPSVLFEKELAEALFPTLNMEGLTG